MSFDLVSDLGAILAEASAGLAAMERRSRALRYAVLVVERQGEGPASVAAGRLRHAIAAMQGPGSPPMALLAAGTFEEEDLASDVGVALLPDGRRVLVTLAAPIPPASDGGDP